MADKAVSKYLADGVVHAAIAILCIYMRRIGYDSATVRMNNHIRLSSPRFMLLSSSSSPAAISSKFQVNCALFDISMKFGTLIEVTNTSIFRYSAKPELRWFP